MNLDEFRTFLAGRKLDEKQIDASISFLHEFKNFLVKKGKTPNNFTYEDIHDFSAHLIQNYKNSFDNYVTLVRYGYFTNNETLILASMELIDGGEVMENFSKKLVEEFGEEIRNTIFGALDVPPLGLHPNSKPAFTKQVITKFLEVVDKKKCEDFLAYGLRDKYTESYKSDRNLFLNSENIDEFLEKKRKKFLNNLEKHKNDGTLFFTQKIDEKVIDYVKGNPQIEAGVRDGNKVFITKIPYMAQQYLNATTDSEKRYYYCHCPWVREALKDNPYPVPAIFCNCSAGYYKNYWEAILEQSIKVELLESILTGGFECKFAFQLPNGVLD